MLNNIDLLIIKNRESLWNNFMIHTNFDFQNKWSKLENWDDQFSNFKTKIFLDELIVEIYTLSQDLLISLNRWSIKKNIKYLKNKIEKFLFNKNIINNNEEKIEYNINSKVKPIKINIIESSCFTPPESFFNSFWLKSLKIDDLENLYQNFDYDYDYHRNNKYFNEKNDNYDDNLMFQIEV